MTGARVPDSLEAVRLRGVLPGLLFAVVFLIYLPSLRSGFVADARAEINEGFVTSLAHLPQVLSLRVLGSHLMLSDRPGEILYLMLNAAVWGKNPFGYHLASILLHAANATLLFVLLRRLAAFEWGDAARPSMKIELALATAVLAFALHPVATESVAEVSFSSNLLVLFFALAALLAATAFPSPDRRITWACGLGGSFCAVAAVFTKESGIAVPLLFIVYWIHFARRREGRPWFVFLGASLGLSLAALGAIFFFAVSRQMNLDFLGGSFGQVFLIQPQLWIFMLGQLLWPTRLVADYTLADMNLPSTAAALAILVLLVAAQGWLAWRSRLGAMGVAVWWLGLAPVSNFLPMYAILADRFYYVPLAGAAMQLAALFLLAARFRPAGFWAVGAVAATLPFLAALTVVRQGAFASDAALWTDTLRKSPHSYLARYSRAAPLIKAGRMEEAAQELEKALTPDMKDSNSYVCRGLIAQCRGEADEAIAQFQQALDVNPHNSEARGDLGLALCQRGRLEEGMSELRAALELDPADADAHANLGLALAQTGRDTEGIGELRKAVQLDPDSAPAHYELGNVLARDGQSDAAAEQFSLTLVLAPGQVEAGTNLGVLYLHEGRYDEAIAQFRRTLALRPGSADLHDNLGVALAQKGDISGAISEFREALRLQPGFPNAQANLDRALKAGHRPK